MILVSLRVLSLLFKLQTTCNGYLITVLLAKQL